MTSVGRGSPDPADGHNTVHYRRNVWGSQRGGRGLGNGDWRLRDGAGELLSRSAGHIMMSFTHGDDNMIWWAAGAGAALIGGFLFWWIRRRRRHRLISFVALLRETVEFDPAVLARVAGKAWDADLGD